MKIWTTEEEAERLKARFSKVNRAAFARDHNLKGNQAMIYQHITGRRPISLEAALIYAKGFGCNLEEISPRLALEVTDAAAKTGTPTTKSGIIEAREITEKITNIEASVKINDLNELISSFLCSDSEGRAQILRMAREVARESSVTVPAASNDQR
jgi:hypothetical protein